MSRAHQEVMTRDRTIVQLKNIIAEKEDIIKCYILRESSFKTEQLVDQEESFSSPEKKGHVLSPFQQSMQSEVILERTQESVHEAKINSIA